MVQAGIAGKAAPVSLKDVTKTFAGGVVAVDNVNLDIDTAKLVTLLGPSGCGKTTTLRLIAGLERPTSGRVLIGDSDVTNLPATDRDVAMVFQSYALFPHMTVAENVSYGLTFSGYGKSEIRERARAGLDLVGLRGFETRLPSELSGGQQQRVAVARALVLEPQVLLFDEPLSNLDAKLRRQVRDDIRAIQRDLKLTVIYVTHDQEEALAVSDEIVVMRNAAVAQTGTPRELYDAPVDSFVADFIGEANLLPCVIEHVYDGLAAVTVDGYGYDLPARGLSPGSATLAVRPSRIVLDADVGFEAEVSKATYVGVRMEYTINASFGAIFAVHDDVQAPLSVGQRLKVAFASSGPVLIPKE
ncbi:MAG: ABC transporter ATP-binding protein [Rhodobacteraceae bacterium]|nr:ABC transporter ATP-binding protein [Paracoccaceae bacterium]